MPREFKPLDFSTIIASSVHDMKNSLGVLLGALDEITDRRRTGSGPTIEELNRLRHQGKRVNGSLVQLLALYRMENALYALNVTENDVGECLEDCTAENEGLLSLRGIEAELACDDGLTWFYDRTLVASVINTVLDNACRHAKDRIRLGGSVSDHRLLITVEDDGPGYPDPLLHPRAVESGPIDAGPGGTGLGLYFSSRVAGMHENRSRHGYITTTNDGIDGGARFTICLP